MAVSQQPTESSVPVADVAPVTSYVSIPLSLSVDNIERLVREKLSGNILVNNIKVPKRDLEVSIERNGRMALWVRDAELHMVLPIKFSTRGDLKTKGKLTIFSRASFAVSKDWEPEVDARSTFQWDKEPRVGFWPFRFRIGDVLAPHIQSALDRGAEDFRAQAIGLYKLRSIAEGGWQRLHGPHPLDAQTQDAWLTMQPREMYLEPITSDRSEVRLNIWMAGELGIAQGDMPPAAEKLPLPKLRHGAPPSKAVVISAPLTVEYARMQTSLRDALVGKTLPSTAGNLTLTDLELYTADPDIVLAARVEGRRTGSPFPSRGYLYLTGQPRYDPETRTLSVRGLQLTPSGINPLAHGARWMLQDAPAWRTELEQRMSWDVAELVEQHQKQLDHYLNKTVDHRFDLWGTIDEVIVTGARPQADGVMLQIQAKGDLELLFVP
jgi:hypothetical protein